MDDGYDFGEAVKEAMRQGYNTRWSSCYGSYDSKIIYADFGQALVDSESLKFNMVNLLEI